MHGKQLFFASDPEPICTVGIVQAIAHFLLRHANLIRVLPHLLATWVCDRQEPLVCIKRDR
jgi:hypothetical protein